MIRPPGVRARRARLRVERAHVVDTRTGRLGVRGSIDRADLADVRTTGDRWRAMIFRKA